MKKQSFNKFMILMIILITTVFITPLSAKKSNEKPGFLLLSLLKPKDTGKARKHESEHRPKGKRQYWLNDMDLDIKPKGYLLTPEGIQKKINVKHTRDGWKVSIKMATRGKFKDKMHGANNIYITDKKVRGKVLHVRTAKWIVIHHNCSWGHKHKHDKKRQRALMHEMIPLEIVPSFLWNGKFHVNTKTGDTLKFTVFHYGQPLSNAAVTVETEKSWKKILKTDQRGETFFQLIKDYYPKNWARFQSHRKSYLLVSAEYEIEEKGIADGKAYNKVKFTSTLPWKYMPAHEDYASYESGLLVGSAFFVASIGGIFFYRQRRKKIIKEIYFNEKN